MGGVEKCWVRVNPVVRSTLKITEPQPICRLLQYNRTDNCALSMHTVADQRR